MTFSSFVGGFPDAVEDIQGSVSGLPEELLGPVGAGQGLDAVRE